jgi:hypothetical protein
MSRCGSGYTERRRAHGKQVTAKSARNRASGQRSMDNNATFQEVVVNRLAAVRKYYALHAGNQNGGRRVHFSL